MPENNGTSKGLTPSFVEGVLEYEAFGDLRYNGHTTFWKIIRGLIAVWLQDLELIIISHRA